MRPDLVVPGENEENFVVARDARVVTVPFSPIEKRFAKEKPQLMPGLQKLREELGDAVRFLDNAQVVAEFEKELLE